MSVKSSNSISDTSGEVVKSGYLKKLKTMRKKYFVLRAESPESSARIEYYDSEKKYRSQQPPKRSISLKTCFNINKRVDTKYKNVIALYTKDDCFCIVLDNEKELDDWLKSLLSLQHDVVDGEPIKPTFEHVWQVTMLDKGLGSTRNILGAYHLCFTDKTLSLVRKSGGNSSSGNATDHVEFSLMSVRRCGHSEYFFYMEVGRSAVTGAGELWMQTEDTNIAQNMGEVILRAMSNNNKEDLGPKPRIRSSSATEASKPILVQRRQTHSGQKNTTYCSPSQDGALPKSGDAPTPVPEAAGSSGVVTSGYANICTTPAQQHYGTAGGFVLCQPHLYHRPSQRRHSVSAGAASPWSGIAHHQRTQSLPLAGATATTSPSAMVSTDNNNAQQIRTHKRSGGNNNTSAANVTTVTNRMGGRDRCDSMPSRCRTSSEGTPYTPTTSSIHTSHVIPSTGSTPPLAVVHPYRSIHHHPHAHLAPYHRPQSLYSREIGREISHSPPTGLAGSPVSPASGICSAACSTDSAGSSLSIDDGVDGWSEYVETSMGRYGISGEETTMGRYGHSLTPDEPIAEENTDEGTDNCYVAVSPTSGSPPLNGGYVPMAPLSSDDGYVDMSPRGRHDMSPAASTCSITSGTPSTDLRFSEYHLEKVSSYFTPSEEDDTSSAERPIRAYSVGSRPDILKLRNSKYDPPNSGQNHILDQNSSRVRAFSVGSRSKGIHSRVLPPHGHHSSHPSSGGKSSSAPLLSGSNSHLGSQSSMERMEDLMELDFSKNLKGNQKSDDNSYVDMSSPRTRTISSSIPAVPAGYVEMRPGISDCNIGSPADLPYMDMKPSVSPVRPASIDTSKEDHPYLDMKPAIATSPLKPSTLASFPSSTSAQNLQNNSPYLEMKPGTSPNKGSTLPHTSNKYNPYYVEMSGSSKFSSSPKNNQIPQKTTSPIQEEYLEMDFKQTKQHQNRTLSGAARTQPVDLPHPKKTNEGYMEMSWNHRHQRKSSLDSAKINVNNNNEDYMNMSGSSRKKERKGSKKDKTRSQPIMIQQPPSTSTNCSTSTTKSSQSPVSTFASLLQNRKNSTGTPPKNHPPNFLPLQSCSYSPSNSPFSSLRRPRSRKNSRRDSKDSTPTNSDNTTIFPFSPGSPIKPFNAKSPENPNGRKCMVDASSGTLKISNSVSGKPPTVGGGDYQKMSSDFNKSDKLSSDYTEMNFENKNLSESDQDYVNFCPGIPKQRLSNTNSEEYGEYAIMRPVQIVHSCNHPVRKISAPLVGTNTNIAKQLSSLTMNNMKPCVFKPIVEPREDNRLGTVSPKVGDVAPHRSFENLQTEEKISSQTENADGNYETLRTGNCISPISKLTRPQSVTGSEKSEKCDKNNYLGSVGSLNSLTSIEKAEKSRPSSVSSDATKGSLSRPSSVSSELGSTSSTIVGDSRPGSVCSDQIKSGADKIELHYASLDLAPVDDDNNTKSPRSGRMQETRSPTPNSASETTTSGFTYAEIDFIKSESLKNKNITH